MERKEAIEVLRRLPIGLMDLSYEQKSDLTEALNIALAALRGPTREQVEKMRGDFIHEGPLVRGGVDWYRCSKCGALASGVEVQNRFCSACGSPMTDEAVDIVMQRLEALKDGTKAD